MPPQLRLRCRDKVYRNKVKKTTKKLNYGSESDDDVDEHKKDYTDSDKENQMQFSNSETRSDDYLSSQNELNDQSKNCAWNNHTEDDVNYEDLDYISNSDTSIEDYMSSDSDTRDFICDKCHEDLKTPWIHCLECLGNSFICIQCFKTEYAYHKMEHLYEIIYNFPRNPQEGKIHYVPKSQIMEFDTLVLMKVLNDEYYISFNDMKRDFKLLIEILSYNKGKSNEKCSDESEEEMNEKEEIKILTKYLEHAMAESYYLLLRKKLKIITLIQEVGIYNLKETNITLGKMKEKSKAISRIFSILLPLCKIEDLLNLIFGFKYQENLEKKLKILIEYRNYGLRTMNDASIFEENKQKRGRAVIV